MNDFNKLKSVAKRFAWLAVLIFKGRTAAPIRVHRGPAKGVMLTLDLRTQSSYWRGNYDDWILQRIDLSRFIKEGDVVWDCGAFVGYYTAVLRLLVGASGRVVSFEGSRKNFQSLNKLPQLNKWDNVRIVHMAVGPDHCEIEFCGDEGGSSGPCGLERNSKSRPPRKVERVRSSGIDEIALELKYGIPSFMKLDLETAEIYALKNGFEIFSRHRPTVLLELHGAEAAIAAGQFLEEYNYRAAPVHLLSPDKSDRIAWNESFLSCTATSRDDLVRLGYIPHVLLCLPQERAPSSAQRP